MTYFIACFIMDKKKVRQITNDEKMKYIRDVDCNPHMKRVDIARKWNIPPSTLNTILGKRKEIERAFEEGVSGKRKRVREGQFPQLESALLKWFKQARASNICVRGRRR